MTLPIPIGRNAANEQFYIDISVTPHLSVSYFSPEQISTFYSHLLKNKVDISAKSKTLFALAATTSVLKFNIPAKQNIFLSYVKDDVFSSTVSSRDEFLSSLAKELKRRYKMQLTNETHGTAQSAFLPLVVIMDDVLEIVISNKKSVGLAFLQLLLLGHQVNIHIIAASCYTCRHLLRQLMYTNMLFQSKFKKFFKTEILINPSVAELVFTSEDFVFFKNASAHDYCRLYPLEHAEKKNLIGLSF